MIISLFIIHPFRGGGSETTETPETTTEDDFVFTLPPFTVRPPATETQGTDDYDHDILYIQ